MEVRRVLDGKITVKVTVRKDFPAYNLSGYSVRYGETSTSLPILHPGQEYELVLEELVNVKNIELIKPGGFVINHKLIR